MRADSLRRHGPQGRAARPPRGHGARPTSCAASPQRNGLEVPEGVFAAPDRFAWRDFLDFLNTYNMAASVIRTGEDYRDIAYEYLAACARDGAIYVELTASVDHARLAGLERRRALGGHRRRDRRRARATTASRRASSAWRCATSASSARSRSPSTPPARPHPYVVGFSLAGDEAGYPPEPFAEAYRIAAAAGLGCTVHAGEWAGAGLGARRARAARHADRPRRARDRGPRARRRARARGRSRSRCAPRATSSSGSSRATRSTRFPVLREAGIPLTLGSDDPPYFGASVGGRIRDRPRALRSERRRSSSASPAPPSRRASPSPHCATTF